MTVMSPAAVVTFAAPHSTNVAYVTDFGLGVEDPAFLGSSVFVNAITGSPPPGGAYTTYGGNLVHFTDVFVSAIDAGGEAAIAGFDTVFLYEVCDFGSHPGLVSALNTYMSTTAGKLVIYDGDRCHGSSSPNYSGFLFPFTTSNPGPAGSQKTLTFVEAESPPATLTRGVAVGDGLGTDSVGDSNTFTSNAGGWCAAENGQNVLGTNSIQVGYVRGSSGALAVYNGQDNWFTFGANSFDREKLRQYPGPAQQSGCPAVQGPGLRDWSDSSFGHQPGRRFAHTDSNRYRHRW